ncbi:hypothetical protein ACFWFF_25850 [Streptomyces sp. NPDC060223]|uniref:hypothetical protein n=1 Tax=unclassified Streptomyces TaxID=2593676 RepID=UPI00363104A5
MPYDTGLYGYTTPPARVHAGVERAFDRLSGVDRLLAELSETPPRAPEADGDEEQLGKITVTHRFVDAPGPVLLLQGADDPLQSREFYTDPLGIAKLPEGSGVHLFDSGHFWPFEAP